MSNIFTMHMDTYRYLQLADSDDLDMLRDDRRAFVRAMEAHMHQPCLPSTSTTLAEQHAHRPTMPWPTLLSILLRSDAC